MAGLGKIMGYVAKAVRKAPKTDIVSKVYTNTPGRVLRMQNAKQAFTLGRNYQSVYIPMKNTSGIRLVTQDAGIAEKLAKMYPERTTATKIAELKKRSDCRAAFTSGAKPQSRLAAVLQHNIETSSAKKLAGLQEMKVKFTKVELPKILKNIETDFYTKFPKIDLGKYDASKIFKA